MTHDMNHDINWLSPYLRLNHPLPVTVEETEENVFSGVNSDSDLYHDLGHGQISSKPRESFHRFICVSICRQLNSSPTGDIHWQHNRFSVQRKCPPSLSSATMRRRRNPSL